MKLPATTVNDRGQGVKITTEHSCIGRIREPIGQVTGQLADMYTGKNALQQMKDVISYPVDHSTFCVNIIERIA